MPVSLQDSDVGILTPHGDSVGKWGSWEGSGHDFIGISTPRRGLRELVHPSSTVWPTKGSLEPLLCQHLLFQFSVSGTTTRKLVLQTICFMVFSSWNLNIKTSTLFYLGRSHFFRQNMNCPTWREGFRLTFMVFWVIHLYNTYMFVILVSQPH